MITDSSAATDEMHLEIGRLVHHLGAYELALLTIVHSLSAERVLCAMANMMLVDKRTQLVKSLLEDRGYTDLLAEFETLSSTAGQIAQDRAICVHNMVTTVRFVNDPSAPTAAVLKSRELNKSRGVGRSMSEYIHTIEQVREAVGRATQLNLHAQDFMHRLHVRRFQPTAGSPP